MRVLLLRSQAGWSHVWLHLFLPGCHVTISRWGVSFVFANQTDGPVYFATSIGLTIAFGALLA